MYQSRRFDHVGNKILHRRFVRKINGCIDYKTRVSGANPYNFVIKS
ncbi:hypothetical protein BBSC_0076 [Bifidobacterium scardovii JCM 12489 = DSM 13734]|nr:hypothetical protein BBSC_0076 [Bifidobacterium scardovii JCM 12489 = DSM 13734]